MNKYFLCRKCKGYFSKNYKTKYSPCELCGESIWWEIEGEWVSLSTWWNPFTWGEGRLKIYKIIYEWK